MTSATSTVTVGSAENTLLSLQPSAQKKSLDPKKDLKKDDVEAAQEDTSTSQPASAKELPIKLAEQSHAAAKLQKEVLTTSIKTTVEVTVKTTIETTVEAPSRKEKEKENGKSGKDERAEVAAPELSASEAAETVKAELNASFLLTPTKGEKWVDHPVQLGFFERIAFGAMQSAILPLILKTNSSLASDQINLICTMDIDKFKTLGEVEEYGIKQMNENGRSVEAKIRSHEELKDDLKDACEQGITYVVTKVTRRFWSSPSSSSSSAA